MPENCPVDFWTHYSYLCLKSKVCPLRSVIKNLKGTELCFMVENIRREHWPFLLSALSVDQSLTKLQLSSNFPIAEYKEMSEKKKRNKNLFFPIPYGCTTKNVTDICRCISQLLQSSKTLKVLMIENIFIRNEDILSLSEALKYSNIEKLSLAGCQLQDEYVETLCRGLQLSSVSWIDLSMCGLVTTGLTYICDLIKAQHLKRCNDMFPDTLRYRLPILDDMKGLRRISLNNNDFGDKGVEMLIHSLEEDIWMKALDLQKCSIENEGARSILKILRSNVGLQLLDLRQNKIDAVLIDRIELQLSLNNTQKEIKFKLGDLWKPPKLEKVLKNRIAKARNVKHAVTSKAKSCTSVEKKLKLNKCLLKEIEKTHLGDIKKNNAETLDVCCQTTYDFNKELVELKSALLHEMRVQNSLKQSVKKYKLENSLLRKELDKMSVLENYILIDHETFVEVTNTFEKFKKFLEAMKKYGLWECIEMLGVSEKSDIALKPFIIDTAKKCMQIVRGDSSSNRKSDSASSSSGVPVKKLSSTGYPHTYDDPQTNKSRYVCEFQQEAHKISRRIQEQIYANEQPQSKVMKVFMDVRDNYSKNILTRQISDDQKNDFVHRLQDYNKQSKPVHQKHHNKLNRSSSNNLVSKEQKSTIKKSVASQTPSAAAESHKQMSSSVSQEMTGKKLTTHSKSSQKITQSSTSVSVISADEPSPIHERSAHGSLKSSEYKSLPSSKYTSLKESSVKSKLPKSSIGSRGSGDHILSHSLHTEKALSSDSESTLRSSIGKLPKNKNSYHGDSYSHSSVKARPDKDVTSLKTSAKSRYHSPVSSIRTNKSKKEFESDSSGGKGDSYKSYLESVSDGSTDKDVKSLSVSEVYSSSKDKRDSNNSSPTSNKSSKPKESHFETAPLKDKDNLENPFEIKSSKSKEGDLETIPSLGEKQSHISKDSVHESSLKSSKVKDSQPTHPEKSFKRNNSESSIPSLSDITTVSSKSLNTDSVMGQLSDI